MPTTKSRLSAFATEALTLRALHGYSAIRAKAKRYGVDLSADPQPPSFEAITSRYDKLLSEWAGEIPSAPGEMLAYLDLVAAIIDGERAEQRGDQGGGSVLSVEQDFGYALTLLTGVRHSLNEAAIDEMVKEERAKDPGARPDATLFALFTEYERVYDRANELVKQGLDKQAQDCSEVAAALEEKIEAIRPATILGALKMLERGLQLGRDLDPPDSHSMIQQALAGLRDIAAREGGQ